VKKLKYFWKVTVTTTQRMKDSKWKTTITSYTVGCAILDWELQCSP